MSEIEYINLGAGEYDRAKAVLNKAKHPGFVGRELFYRCATNGVVCVAVSEGVDYGIAMITKGKLQALSVIAAAQGKGIGQGLMRRLQPEWVSAIADRISFFERCGYAPLGAPKVGQNGKHATQLMQRLVTAENGAPSDAGPTLTPRVQPEPTPPRTLLTDLLDESIEGRSIATLQMLDGLIDHAIQNGKYESALKIMEAASAQLRISDRARARRP